MAGEKILNLMANMAAAEIPPTSRTDLVWGTVLNVSPLQVKIDGESGLILDDEFVILSPLCKTFLAFTLKHKHQGVHGMTDTRLNPVVVWRGLRSGDRLILLKYKGGNQFYALQREGALDDSAK